MSVITLFICPNIFVDNREDIINDVTLFGMENVSISIPNEAMGYTKFLILPLLKSMDFGLLDCDFVLEKL